MPDLSLLRIEKLLASAHRATWAATLEAEHRIDQGLAEDLHGICDELRRLIEDCARGKVRR